MTEKLRRLGVDAVDQSVLTNLYWGQWRLSELERTGVDGRRHSGGEVGLHPVSRPVLAVFKSKD